jgi:hypothetical protein
MKKLCWTLVVAVAMVASASSAFAQCARGVVSVQGKVANLPSGADADVVVVLKTPKGDFSKTSVVTNGQFRVDADFSTLKSWSPVSGHHCSNKPTLVEITLKQANQVLAQKSLKFTDEFESRDSLSYSLKRELTLDAAEHGVAGENPAARRP